MLPDPMPEIKGLILSVLENCEMEEMRPAKMDVDDFLRL